MASTDRDVFICNAPPDLDAMTAKAAFDGFYKDIVEELALLPCMSLEEAVKRGREEALIWIQKQKNEIPPKSIIEDFDKSCDKFQNDKNSQKGVVLSFIRACQRNQRSLATLKEQLQKLDVHLHQNIAMQHQVHMLVRDRREMRKAAQNGAPGAGKGPVAKNPTPTPTMLVKQVLQQSTGVIASSATQSAPVQKSATQRIDDTPNELTGNIIMFIKNTVEKYMGVEDNEAIEAGRAMASSLLSQTGSQYEVVFFRIMEDYVRILVESRAHEKHDQGEESIGQYYKSMQPVMLYFASAKKCCEELLADVREENGKPTN